MYIVWRKNHNCSFLNGIISRKITKGGLSIADWLMVEEENEDDTDEHMRVPLNDEQEQGSRSSMGKLKIHRSLAAGFYRVQIRVEQSWSLISWVRAKCGVWVLNLISIRVWESMLFSTDFWWPSFVMGCLVHLCWRRCLACWWFWIRCLAWFLLTSLELGVSFMESFQVAWWICSSRLPLP